METPLLQTKLYIPPARPELVPRPRLVERLNEGLNRKLTLISAPAGFGKTTLVSEWLRQNDEFRMVNDESKKDPIHRSSVAWPLILVLVGIAILMVGLLLPAEWCGRLSQPLAARIGPCLEHMPDG